MIHDIRIRKPSINYMITSRTINTYLSKKEVFVRTCVFLFRNYKKQAIKKKQALRNI